MSEPGTVIPLGQPTVGDPELRAVAEVFASGWLAGAGPACRRLEERFAGLVGTRHALATANCGAALHLAMLTLGVRPGDEVVVADYTFPATGHAVGYVGARPVFADVRPDVWTLDPAATEAAITERTVGIIAVDIFGQCADYAELRKIADRHKLFLLEDAAAAAGSTYQNRPAGSFGDVATFSFHGRKGITSGEGGMFVTDADDTARRARKLHTYGIEGALTRAELSEVRMPVFDELGYNYRLSDIQAAVMLVQLDRLDAITARRHEIAATYRELLHDLDLVTLPAELPDRRTNWQTYALTLDPSVNRGAVAAALRGRGVQSSFGTYASHLQPVYGASPPCPVSADVFARHMSIPMHANLTDDQAATVAAAVREVVTANESRGSA